MLALPLSLTDLARELGCDFRGPVAEEPRINRARYKPFLVGESGSPLAYDKYSTKYSYRMAVTMEAAVVRTHTAGGNCISDDYDGDEDTYSRPTTLASTNHLIHRIAGMQSWEAIDSW